MIEFAPLIAAIGLGIRHSLEPAHLASLAVLVSLGGSRRRALLYTLSYTVAHGGIVALLGLLALMAGGLLGSAATELIERAGGAVLLLIAIAALRAALSGRDAHPIGEFAARLGTAGLGGAALFGALHALGGEGVTQALATAGLVSGGLGAAGLIVFVGGLAGTNLAAALLLSSGLAPRLPAAARLTFLVGYGIVALLVGLDALFG